MSEPTFKHKSWDDYSFWQSVYYYTWDKQYRTTLQNDILQAYRAARADLDRLSNVQQVNPLASLMVEWRNSLAGFSRDISCDEAEGVNTALQALAERIHAQWVSDEQALKSGTKQRRQAAKPGGPSPVPAVARPTTPARATAAAEDTDDDADAVLLRMASAGFGLGGHSAQTARARPTSVKAQPSPPPTPEQVWAWAQKELEDDCDDTIEFGEHEVAASVLYKLNIHNQTGEQRRPRKCENTNNETRIVIVGHRVFWTVGLTHKKRRDANTFVAYERVGKRDFRYVAGNHHPRDSNQPH